ncbi:MAG: translocation/assembly module TamB domain-containing protein, partial [Calditrichia bacterium]|nr:translocation/assembly module TamB domain-containing protein [Calditrichia bacterium]
SSLINMNFKINFDKWDINSLNGKLAFNIYNSYVNNTQLKKIQLNVDAVKGNYTIDSTSGAYLTDESVFNLSGNFNGKLKGEIDLKFEEANFTRLGEVIGLEKLQGYGSGYFRFSGNLLDPDLSSYLLLDSLGYADLKGYGIEENIQIDNILGKRLGNYQLDILSGNVGPINITDAIIYLNIEHNKINLDSLTFYNFDNLLDIKGKVEIDTSSVTIALKKFEAMYQKIKMYNPDSLFLSFKNNELHFDKVYFETSTGGSIDARGFINFSDSLSNFAIDINKVNLKFLNQFELIPYKLSGIISFNGNLTKKLSNPDILFKGELNTLRLDTFNLGKISLNGKYLEKNIEVDKLNWKVENSEFSVFALFNVDSFLTGKKGNPEDIILVDFKDFELGNFKNLLGFNYPFAGKINSHITIKNTLLNLFAKGDISLSNFQYREYIVDSLSTLIDYENENVSLNDGVLNLYGTEFLFFAKTFLKYSIEKKKFSFFNEPLTAFLGGSAKSLDFLGDINKEVQNVRGDIQINIEVGGTVGKPLIKAGSIDIEDGKLYLYKLTNTINIKKLNANFEDGILYIDLPEAYARWQGKGKNFIYRFLNKVASVFTFWQKKENEGLIAVKGKIDLRRLAKPKLDLDVKMTHAYVNYFIENVEVVASTKNLKITGRDTIMVVGDITVDQGDYKLDLEKYEKNLLLQSGAREKPPYLSLNLNVDIPGNFYLTQDEPLNSFNFQIMGGVRVLKEPLQLIETSGILDIMEGELFLYSKQIKVISGKISFLNPKELPDMELLAELLQNPYRFEISERGKISSPTLDIKIYPIDGGEEITYDIKDKIAILITGLPFSEMSNIDLKETGMQAVTASAISFVQNKTKKYTGLDKIEMGNTQANRLNEGLQDESFFSFGKYLSNNLYFEYKTGMTGSGGIGAPKISWEPGNEVQMNYRLNRNWSFGTNYGLSFSGNRKIKFDFSWKLNF